MQFIELFVIVMEFKFQLSVIRQNLYLFGQKVSVSKPKVLNNFVFASGGIDVKPDEMTKSVD